MKLNNIKYIMVFFVSAVFCLLFQSCLFDAINMVHDRKHKSILRFGSTADATQGKIRTDGLYVHTRWLKRKEKTNEIVGYKFFEDGTKMELFLEGNEIDSILPNLIGFKISKITISYFGLYSIHSDTIYHEAYTQQMRFIYPCDLSRTKWRIIDENTIAYINHVTKNLITFTFVPCSIPITSHHPFKSKKWLWNNEEERKNYLKEWKKIKKERKKSKIKYKYTYY